MKYVQSATTQYINLGILQAWYYPGALPSAFAAAKRTSLLISYSYYVFNGVVIFN